MREILAVDEGIGTGDCTRGANRESRVLSADSHSARWRAPLRAGASPLPPQLGGGSGRWAAMAMDADEVAATLFAERAPLDRFLEEVRRKVALRALSEFGGNCSRAARAIAMDRKTLARLAATCRTAGDTLPPK